MSNNNPNNHSPYPIHISIATQEFKVQELTKTGLELKALAGVDPQQFDLFLEVDGNNNVEPIPDDAVIELVENMQFFVKHRQDQHVPIIIDGQHVSAPKHVMTGNEILALVGRQSGYALYLIPTARADERILDQQSVYLIRDEQFVTVKNDITNGSTDVLLPSSEMSFLTEQGFETQLERNPQNPTEILLVVKNYNLGEKYHPQVADLLVKIPQGFPNTPMDMFWTSPTVTKADGSMPAATETREQFFGRDWQRFSRHYTMNGWNPSMGALRGHFNFIAESLLQGQ